MIEGLAIRDEAPEDRGTIHGLIKRAFTSQPHADGNEQDLVDLLRERGELVLSLVATLPGKGVVGHIGFSPVTIDGADCRWCQMAPVSVEPALHRLGVGSALIRAGIERLDAAGARGIGVVGDPAYYERFGFSRLDGLSPDGPEAVFFRAMVLREPMPRGVMRYASAFG